MTIKDLGDWAEAAFAALCSEAGVTRNKSIQDRTGWDYLVEFAPRRIAGVPADLQPAGLTARTQVKSKAKGRPTTVLKLSNALRFAKDPAPCFVVLFLATNGGRPLRIYAKHFWTDEIERALHRAREAGAVDDNDLARQTLSLSFTAADEHTSDLLDWMRAIIEAVGPNYAEAKATFERTVGLGDGSIHGVIRFLESDLEALVDHQIGLRSEAPIVEITVQHARFGIDAPSPLASGRPDFAHMRVHPLPCRIRVRGADGVALWLDGQLYRPAIPDLPKALHKFRVVAEFLELVVPDTGEGVVHINNQAEDRRTLALLRALLSVWTQCALGALDIQVFLDDKVIFGFATHLQVITNARWLQQTDAALACLQRAADGVEPKDLALSFTDLMDAWSDVAQFAALVDGANLSLTLQLDAPPALVTPARALLARDAVEVGGWTFMAVIERPITALTVDGSAMTIQCGAPIVREGLVRRGPASAFAGELRDRYAMTLQLGGPDVLELFGGDFGAMMRFLDEGGEEGANKPATAKGTAA